MSLLATAATRLSRQDMLQGLTVLLAAMCLALALRWPTGGALVNDSWSVLAPVRGILLAFGGLAWGAGIGSRPRRREMGATFEPTEQAPAYGQQAWRTEVLATLAAVVFMVVVTAPFDVLAYAATYPVTGMGWSLLAPLLAALGFFGMGLLLGRLTRVTHTASLLPLLVPALLAGTAWLDITLEARVANPWFAVVEPSPWFAAAMLLFTVLGVGGALVAKAEDR